MPPDVLHEDIFLAKMMESGHHTFHKFFLACFNTSYKVLLAFVCPSVSKFGKKDRRRKIPDTPQNTQKYILLGAPIYPCGSDRAVMVTEVWRWVLSRKILENTAGLYITYKAYEKMFYMLGAVEWNPTALKYLQVILGEHPFVILFHIISQVQSCRSDLLATCPTHGFCFMWTILLKTFSIQSVIPISWWQHLT